MRADVCPFQRMALGEDPTGEAVPDAAPQLKESAGPQSGDGGLPKQLKAGVESLSGMSMDHVKVNYNSAKPAQLNAFAYAQGSEIHLGPGQERHLPHEAWHVVQQAQDRVRPTAQMKGGESLNDDHALEHEADVMGAKAAAAGIAASRGSPMQRVSGGGTHYVQLKSPAFNGKAPIQRAKVSPNGNFARYVAANLTNTGVTAFHPNQAEVAAEGDFAGVSAPVNTLGWAHLNPNNYTLAGGVGGGVSTQIDVSPRIGQNGNNHTRMHLIHHSLAANANGNANNIVLGSPGFNTFHTTHVENFLGDSMGANFYTTSGNQSLTAMLLAGENIGIAGVGHANAGAPYVVGNPPTFPASLLTGVTLANNNGVPLNAQEITTDEDILDRHVTLWYEVIPVFGLVAGTIYASMVAMLNNHYLNNRVGAVQTVENVPAGVLGAGNMLSNMANALAQQYVTALTVKGSFFTPDPVNIPIAGTTADNLPWKDSRIPARTLNNPGGNPYWQYQMQYDAGMGILNGAPAVIAQL